MGIPAHWTRLATTNPQTSFLGNSAQRIELGSNIWNMTSNDTDSWEVLVRITTSKKSKKFHGHHGRWNPKSREIGKDKTNGSSPKKHADLKHCPHADCSVGLGSKPELSSSWVICLKLPRTTLDGWRTWNPPTSYTHIRYQHVRHSSAFHRYWNSLQMFIDMRTWAVRIHTRVRSTAIII